MNALINLIYYSIANIVFLESIGEIIAEPTHLWCETIHQAFAFHASPNVMPKPMRHILGAKRRMTLLKTLKSQFGNPVNGNLDSCAILSISFYFLFWFKFEWIKEDLKSCPNTNNYYYVLVRCLLACVSSFVSHEVDSFIQYLFLLCINYPNSKK